MLLRSARPRASRSGGLPTITRGAARSTRDDDRHHGGAHRRGRHFGDGVDGQDSRESRRDSDVAPKRPPPRIVCGRRLRAAVAPDRGTCHAIGPCLHDVGWVGLQVGKPRRASGSAGRPRSDAVTDFRAEQGLVVAPALPENDRGARPRGDAWTASRKGKALEGRHRWESAEAVAGMRRQGVATR
jgi:hypothetical protein